MRRKTEYRHPSASADKQQKLSLLKNATLSRTKKRTIAGREDPFETPKRAVRKRRAPAQQTRQEPHETPNETKQTVSYLLMFWGYGVDKCVQMDLRTLGSRSRGECLPLLSLHLGRFFSRSTRQALRQAPLLLCLGRAVILDIWDSSFLLLSLFFCAIVEHVIIVNHG